MTILVLPSIRAVFFALACVACCDIAYAQKVVEPEDCILNTLRGSSAAANATAMVRFNCVRRYLQQVESKAQNISASQFPEATIVWRAPMQAYPAPIPPMVVVTLKNNTNLRIISAMITVNRKGQQNVQSYRLLAEYPIDPFTVGKLSAEILWEDEPITTHSEFWALHDWSLVSVKGVPR